MERFEARGEFGVDDFDAATLDPNDGAGSVERRFGGRGDFRRKMEPNRRRLVSAPTVDDSPNAVAGLFDAPFVRFAGIPTNGSCEDDAVRIPIGRKKFRS